MEQSRNLFSIQNEIEPVQQHIHTVKLTNRQYKLHEVLLEHSERSRGRLTRKDMLKRLDSEYLYSIEKAENPKRTFINMTCLRELTKDLDAITTYGGFHKVYVGGRYATSELEIKIHLLKEEIRIKKEWWKLQQKRKKAKLDRQTIMQFTGYEKDEWESYIRKEEKKLKEMENSYEEERAYTHQA
jgi:hypothetical protein